MQHTSGHGVSDARNDNIALGRNLEGSNLGGHSENVRLARSYLDWVKHVRSLSPHTTYQYADRLHSLLDFAGARPLGELSLAQLESWANRPRHKRGGRPGKPATVAWDVGVLRGFYRWLVARGHVRRNPTELLVAPKVRNVLPRAIEDGTWLRVWTSDLDDEMRVALGLMYYCGLRRHEVCSLQVAQVNQGRRQLQHFVRKGSITAVLPYGSCIQLFQERLPHLQAERFLDAFERVVRSRSRPPEEATAEATTRAGERSSAADGPRGGTSAAYVLGWASERRRPSASTPAGMTNPDQVNKRVLRLQERLGIKAPFTPHACRHSFCTALVRMDIPLIVISRLASHSDPATTARYIRTAEDPLAKYLGRDLSGSNLGGHSESVRLGQPVDGKLMPSRWR